MSAPTNAQLDHLVVMADSLDAGVQWCEQTLGITPNAGGEHPLMGTHNRLINVSSPAFPRAYLEIIALHPGMQPTRDASMRRWFDMDDEALRQHIAQNGPQLIHWVARTDDIGAALRKVPDLGVAMPMTRGEWSWTITVPGDGHRPGRGLVPTLIQWSDARHPADAMPDSGRRLTLLAGEHPEPDSVRKEIAALGLSDVLKVTYAKSPRLAAMIRTPRGVATL